MVKQNQRALFLPFERRVLMFRMKMMSNRRFVPTNFIFILILGFLSLVLWETTRFFGRVQPAYGPLMVLMLVLSSLVLVYFAVSFILYLYDHAFSEPWKRWAAILAVGLVVVVYMVSSFVGILPSLNYVHWSEDWGEVAQRYSYSFADNANPNGHMIAEEQQHKEALREYWGTWNWKYLLLFVAVVAVCLVADILFLPLRIYAAREKGYDSDNLGNTAASVALLLLALMGLAKPSLYLWMAALLLVLLVVRIPKLGVKYALLFTIFQPFAILDGGFQRAKFISSGMYFGRFVTGEMQARMTGLQQTGHDERNEEFQEELRIRDLAQEGQKKRMKENNQK